MRDYQLDFECGVRALAFVSDCAKNAKTPAELATAMGARTENEFHSFSPMAMYGGLIDALTNLIEAAEAATDPGVSDDA